MFCAPPPPPPPPAARRPRATPQLSPRSVPAKRSARGRDSPLPGGNGAPDDNGQPQEELNVRRVPPAAHAHLPRTTPLADPPPPPPPSLPRQIEMQAEAEALEDKVRSLNRATLLA
jgi:hypothetical protein